MYTVVMLGVRAGLFSVCGGDVRGEGWTVQCIHDTTVSCHWPCGLYDKGQGSETCL